MPDGHRKRRKTYNEPGHGHYLTYSCVNRWPLLRKERTCRWVLEAIETARQRHGFDVHAFVIMPEHVHLLVRPRSAEKTARRAHLLEARGDAAKAFDIGPARGCEVTPHLGGGRSGPLDGHGEKAAVDAHEGACDEA